MPWHVCLSWGFQLWNTLVSRQILTYIVFPCAQLDVLGMGQAQSSLPPRSQQLNGEEKWVNGYLPEMRVWWENMGVTSGEPLPTVPTCHYSHHTKVTAGLWCVWNISSNFFFLSSIYLALVWFLVQWYYKCFNHFIKSFYPSNATVRKVMLYIIVIVKLHWNNLWESIIFNNVCYHTNSIHCAKGQEWQLEL